jgi:hypothetical protein
VVLGEHQHAHRQESDHAEHSPVQRIERVHRTSITMGRYRPRCNRPKGSRTPAQLSRSAS